MCRAESLCQLCGEGGVEGDVSVAEGGGVGGEERLCGLEGVRMGIFDMGS